MKRMTDKLYYENPYCKNFSASVKACVPKGERFEVVLNRTAFYPEGGGQPADTGVLNTVNVLDVQERDGIIFHLTDKPFAVGEKVTGGVNWSRRFSQMQLHSGEHIVSGIVHRLFGLDNVGFHMGAKAVTVDFNGELSPENLQTVESLANEAVFCNLPVQVWWPSPQELAGLNYRSKKELAGAVRIVTVPGYDVCACCGTHVSHTGEIGLIRLVSAQKYKGGVRVGLLCGWQALEDCREKARSVSGISVALSAKPEEVVPAVERLIQENSGLKQEAAVLREKILESKAAAVLPGTRNLSVFEDGLSPTDLRRYCLLLCEKCSGTAAVFSGRDGAGYRYAVGSRNDDVRALCKALNQAFSGRGGGSKELAQGSLQGGREALERFLQNISGDFIKEMDRDVQLSE